MQATVYIITNKHKTVLYTGVTSNIGKRLQEHITGKYTGFSKTYNCHYLLYYENYNNMDQAIEREKQIKKWRRSKKTDLIKTFNPNMDLLNHHFLSNP